MQKQYTTNRLLLTAISTGDADFMLELVNTPGWIRFIGDRNIKTKGDAANYIQKILDNPDIIYWVVHSLKDKTPLGVISFIKRDYLEHHDIGFAFLPQYHRNGYAYEATLAVLNDAIQQQEYSTVLATLLKDNHPSQQLLNKLGFHFEHLISSAGEDLMVYAFSGIQ